MSPWVSLRFLQTQSDARLLTLTRLGHERAFEVLVTRYRRQLHAYCRRLLSSDARAEDALQQAFMQAWIALRDGTVVRDPKPWLYRIVHNSAISSMRRSGKDHAELAEIVHGDAPGQSNVEIYMTMRDALENVAALPENQRQVILRTAFEGDSHEEVARELGLSHGAVRGLAYRARASLRAAATALIPMPLVQLLVRRRRTDPVTLTQRLSELGTGGGSAGAAGVLLKGGTVAITAAVAVAGAVTIQHGPPASPTAVLGHARSSALRSTVDTGLASRRSAAGGQRTVPGATSALAGAKLVAQVVTGQATSSSRASGAWAGNHGGPGSGGPGPGGQGSGFPGSGGRGPGGQGSGFPGSGGQSAGGSQDAGGQGGGFPGGGGQGAFGAGQGPDGQNGSTGPSSGGPSGGNAAPYGGGSGGPGSSGGSPSGDDPGARPSGGFRS